MVIKAVDEVGEGISRGFARRAIADALGIEHAWPATYSLGRPSRASLEAAIEELPSAAREWATLGSATSHLGVKVEWEERSVCCSVQIVPRRLSVPSAAAAAAVAGGECEALLGTVERRVGKARSADLPCDDEALAWAIGRTLRLEEGDFDLVLRAAAYLASNDVGGRTPRSLPIPGFSGKWLDSSGRRGVVARLACKEADLGLRAEPRLVSFREVDPGRLRELSGSGLNGFGTWVEGGPAALGYVPERVVVVENKETFLEFPAMDGTVVVFGSGDAGIPIIPTIPWVSGCRDIVYWGDMDADGLEALGQYRDEGLDCRSILMDEGSFQAWYQCGTNEKTGKVDLKKHVRLVPFPNLDDGEARLYCRLTDPGWTGYRRIEQEKIPLDAAREAIG